MYKQNNTTPTDIFTDSEQIGVPLERQIESILNNGETIDESAPLIYTEKKHGVQPAYDPRADKFEIALDAIDRTQRMQTAKGDHKPHMEVIKDEPKPTGTEGEKDE